MGAVSQSFQKIQAFLDQALYFECLQVDVILYFAMKGEISPRIFIEGDSHFSSGLDEK